MKHLLSAITATLLLAGCAAGSRVALPPAAPYATAMSASPYRSLKLGIDTLLTGALFPPSGAGIKIVSLTRNEVLYELNPDQLFHPASNEKLFTSFAALTTLGEDFLLSTVVTVDSSRGILHIKGYGDPLFSSSDIDSLARLVAAAIPPRKTWDLVCDISYFDDNFWGSGWAWDHEPDSYAMFITPLILDANTIEVVVRPGERAGDAPIVFTRPGTGYVTIENTAVTVADSLVEPLQISRRWRERSNTLTVAGQIRFGARPRTENLSVWQPERYAGTVFAERLGVFGVPVTSVSIDTTGAGGREIARFSRRLDSVVTVMNKVSDNLTGEVLLKVLAAERSGQPGTTDAGISIVYSLLAGHGTDTTTISIADGSGLSRYNLTSAATIIRMLEAIYREGTHYNSFRSSLPIAGIDGTIGRRMVGTAAEGNLRAKTGSINGVSALSGYVTTADGELLAFSILMQNFVGPNRPYRLVQDRIGELLSTLRRSEL